MRLLLFFDLPVEKAAQRHAYTVFVKDIKKLGFFMLQESVYTKFCIDEQVAAQTVSSVKRIAPKDGSLFVLSVTEKQFSSINIILGTTTSDVITSEERVIEI